MASSFRSRSPVLLEPDEDALSSANRRQSSLFMDRDLPLRASPLNVMKAPTYCVQALSSARCCSHHALALPSVCSAPDVPSSCHTGEKAVPRVCGLENRTSRGPLSRGLLLGLKRNGGYVVSLLLPPASLSRCCDVVSQYRSASESWAGRMRTGSCQDAHYILRRAHNCCAMLCELLMTEQCRRLSIQVAVVDRLLSAGIACDPFAAIVLSSRRNLSISMLLAISAP